MATGSAKNVDHGNHLAGDGAVFRTARGLGLLAVGTPERAKVEGGAWPCAGQIVAGNHQCRCQSLWCRLRVGRLALPLDATGSNASNDREANSPLLRMEPALHRVVSFVVIPIFGFANAGLSFANIGVHQMVAPLTLGVAGGLLVGKLIGVFGVAVLAVKLGFARLSVRTGFR